MLQANVDEFAVVKDVNEDIHSRPGSVLGIIPSSHAAYKRNRSIRDLPKTLTSISVPDRSLKMPVTKPI